MTKEEQEIIEKKSQEVGAKVAATNGVCVDYAKETGGYGAPCPVGESGQHKSYWVLAEEERAKGFVRPVRRTYIHVGIRPKYPLRDLTPEEKERYKDYGYAKYEEYPNQSEGSVVGRFWTERDLKSGCGTSTTMGLAIAETYARNPNFYGSTFCCLCGNHYPVGEAGEFEWEDGSKVGT